MTIVVVAGAVLARVACVGRCDAAFLLIDDYRSWIALTVVRVVPPPIALRRAIGYGGARMPGTSR
jgi:hypothetical protein